MNTLGRTAAQGTIDASPEPSIARHGGVPTSTLLALMLAVFTVAAGYGLLLPLLPFLVERLLGTGATEIAISRHIGLLTSVYTLAIFLFAPLWGRSSDKIGRRRILLIGLLSFSASRLVFQHVNKLTEAKVPWHPRLCLDDCNCTSLGQKSVVADW